MNDSERRDDLTYYYRTVDDQTLARHAQRLIDEASGGFKDLILDVSEKALGGMKLSWRQRESLVKHIVNATLKQEEEAG